MRTQQSNSKYAIQSQSTLRIYTQCQIWGLFCPFQAQMKMTQKQAKKTLSTFSHEKCRHVKILRPPPQTKTFFFGIYFSDCILQSQQSHPNLHTILQHNHETRTTLMHTLQVGGNWTHFECERFISPRWRGQHCLPVSMAPRFPEQG